MEKIGETIRKIRAKRGMSITEFAKLLGVSRVTVSRWENGVMAPRARMVKRIMELAEPAPAAEENEAPPAEEPKQELPPLWWWCVILKNTISEERCRAIFSTGEYVECRTCKYRTSQEEV